MVRPNGESEIVWQDEVRFQGEQHGWATHGPLRLRIGEAGLHWFELLVAGRLMARFPLIVLYRPLGAE